MIPYIACFVIVILETLFAERMFKKGNKKLGYLAGALIVLTMSIFAGVRDLTVGADVLGYVVNDFDRASQYDLFTLMGASNEGPGFVALSFICNRLFGDIHVFLFVIQAIMSTFLFLFIKDNRKKQSMTLMMAIYLLLCFAESFCIIRQHIALAICLYATKYMNMERIRRKELIKMLAFLLIACSFHTSMILYGVVYLLMYLNRGKGSKKKRNMLIVSVGTCVAFLMSSILIMVPVNLGILSERYLLYFNTSTSFVGEFGAGNLLRIFYKVVWFVLFAFTFFKARKKGKNLGNFLPCILLIIDLIIYIISCRYIVFSRFNIILFDTVLLMYGHELFEDIKIRANRLILYAVATILLAGNFYYLIVYKTGSVGSYNVYPYAIEDDFESPY